MTTLIVFKKNYKTKEGRVYATYFGKKLEGEKFIKVKFSEDCKLRLNNEIRLNFPLEITLRDDDYMIYNEKDKNNKSTGYKYVYITSYDNARQANLPKETLDEVL